MRIIGVIDLARGRAVHARAGQRESYQPISIAAGVPVNGDAIALARAYVQLGVDEFYVADLDAITGGTPPHEAVGSVASLGVPFWIDAGVSSTATASTALSTGAARVIVGLETLQSFASLDVICRALGSHVAFSLDLRDGQPVAFAQMRLEDVAGRAADAGVTAMTLIDLARVGMGAGPGLTAIARVRETVPGVMLVAGGGVRGPEDLGRLADAGCDGALVATALHDGRLRRRDVAAARELQRSVSR
jgi:phosphoribosylformimino-5-aminoimidazole carboxamide ribotide isomerase